MIAGNVGTDPGSTLTLRDSLVSGNSLRTTTRDATIAGGGIHAIGGATLVRTRVTRNTPGDCDGS